MLSTESDVHEGKIGELLDEIIKSEVRILIMMTPLNHLWYYIFDYLYDAGLRRDDFVMFVNAVMMDIYQFAGQPEIFKKRTHFAHRSFNIMQPTFVGEVGGKYIGMYLGLFGIFPHPLSCLCYDGFLQFGGGLEEALFRGEDYEDPDVLNREMKL
ncbi:MAG: hypothetical protein V2I33_22225, partial [Kangiellaceae bacterium]|jgi:hypothetical protein|nr:hypothetical protein [Kangiellaceae bacterium]